MWVILEGAHQTPFWHGSAHAATRRRVMKPDHLPIGGAGAVAAAFVRRRSPPSAKSPHRHVATASIEQVLPHPYPRFTSHRSASAHSMYARQKGHSSKVIPRADSGSPALGDAAVNGSAGSVQTSSIPRPSHAVESDVADVAGVCVSG